MTNMIAGASQADVIAGASEADVALIMALCDDNYTANYKKARYDEVSSEMKGRQE